MDSRTLTSASLIGFIIALLGFVGYVINPEVVYIGVFAVGIVMLVIGYVGLLSFHKKLVEDVPDTCDTEDSQDDESL